MKRPIPRSTQNLRISESQKLVITIDGPAGVGKSTVAKQLARAVGLTYLDTGATYRSVAYLALQEHVPVTDERQVAALARQLRIRLTMGTNGRLRVFLHGKEVTNAIRTEQVTEAAVVVSQFPTVRAAMVKHQRKLANRQGVVVEGRDTGSVVFPHATYKFFLDADPAIRAKRRQRELFKRYGSRSSITLIREQIDYRDGLDRTRRVGPLVKPAGAVTINTTHRTASQVVRLMLRHIRHANHPSPP